MIEIAVVDPGGEFGFLERIIRRKRWSAGKNYGKLLKVKRRRGGRVA